MQMSPTANKPKGQEKHNRRSYLLMVFFVSFVEKRMYPWQHPLQKLLLSFWGGFLLARIFFLFLLPHPSTDNEQNLWEMPPRTKQNRERPDKKEKKEGGGKKQSTAARHSASIKLWGFFLSQHTCTESQPAALLLFKTAPHQDLNAR